METVIVSIVCIALIILGGMSMSQGFLASVDRTANGWQLLGKQAVDIARTSLSPLSANMASANILEVKLRNEGQTKLADFDKWDFIVQYYDFNSAYYVKWLPYTESALEDNEWKKEGIYLDAEGSIPEVFEPEILNPGEEIVLQARLNPVPGAGTTGLVVVATPNGVSAELPFSGYSP